MEVITTLLAVVGPAVGAFRVGRTLRRKINSWAGRRERRILEARTRMGEARERMAVNKTIIHHELQG